MNEPEMRRFDSNTGLNPPKERESSPRNKASAVIQSNMTDFLL